jgi:hypothetical protein
MQPTRHTPAPTARACRVVRGPAPEAVRPEARASWGPAPRVAGSRAHGTACRNAVLAGTCRAAGGKTSRPPINVIHCSLRVCASFPSPCRVPEQPQRGPAAPQHGQRRLPPPAAGALPHRSSFSPTEPPNRPLVAPSSLLHRPSPGHTPASPHRNFTGTTTARAQGLHCETQNLSRVPAAKGELQ